MLTDRDLAVRAIREGLHAKQTMVGEVMTPCPKTVKEDATIERSLAIMKAGSFRRVPVVDSVIHIAGVLGLDDILDLLCEEFGMIRGLLLSERPVSLARNSSLVTAS